MSKKYPQYPTLSKKGHEEAQTIINEFKKQLLKTAEEAIGNLYVDVPSYIESDSWSNFRNEVIDGFKNYENRKLHGDFDFKEIRAEIYKEFKEDIIKDLNADLVEENKKLKEENKRIMNKYINAINHTC